MKTSAIRMVLNNQATPEQTIRSIQSQSYGDIEHKNGFYCGFQDNGCV